LAALVQSNKKAAKKVNIENSPEYKDVISESYRVILENAGLKKSPV